MTATETKKPLRQASWLDGRAMWLAIPVVSVLILTALRKLPQRPPSQALLDHTVLVPPETRSSPYVVGSSVEARAALRQALEMKHAGKRTKAQRLFLHALHMEPDSPDILNEYGMFLEEEQEVLQADRLYTRALALAPCHHGALDNRVRTSTVVEGIDRQQLDSIDNKVKRLLSIPPGSFVLRRVARESYYQHVYHTVALEGNTLSLPEIRRILQTRRAVCGRSLSEQNEVLGIDAAMTFINATLAAHLGPVTPLDILEIHRRVLGPVDPVEAGRFRRGQVYVGRHIPPPADAVPGLVEELTQWLASEEAASLHPVELGALSHYRLVYIHPFNDGNGRTARLLMNFLLMQAEYPPVTVRAEQRAEYYATLEAANAGDVRPFIRFVGRCAEATLDRYLVAVSRQPRSALSGDGMVESGLPLSNPISAVLVQN